MKEFINCRFCGKIVNAQSCRCHKCGGIVNPIAPDSEESVTEAHAEGGYDTEEDDFDYEEFVQSEFGSGTSPKRSVWYYVAWLMIAILLLPLLLSLIQ